MARRGNQRGLPGGETKQSWKHFGGTLAPRAEGRLQIRLLRLRVCDVERYHLAPWSLTPMPLGDCICKCLCETWGPAAWTPAPEPVATVAMPGDAVPGIEGSFGRGFIRSGLRQVLLQRSSKTAMFDLTFSQHLWPKSPVPQSPPYDT